MEGEEEESGTRYRMGRLQHVGAFSAPVSYTFSLAPFRQTKQLVLPVPPAQMGLLPPNISGPGCLQNFLRPTTWHHERAQLRISQPGWLF